jgi:methylase of polypeptide subunit release factors
MSGTPYISSEDSALIREVLRPYAGGTCLEIGAGNGGALVELAQRFDVAVGTDIAKPAMRDWRGAQASYLLADGAACMRSSTFDLVAFNPPYLREEVTDTATQGGASLEVPKKFLREALRVVKKGGAVVFLLNDSADLSEFADICEAAGFSMSRVRSVRSFFEELTVYAATAKILEP